MSAEVLSDLDGISSVKKRLTTGMVFRSQSWMPQESRIGYRQTLERHGRLNLRFHLLINLQVQVEVTN